MAAVVDWHGRSRGVNLQVLLHTRPRAGKASRMKRIAEYLARDRVLFLTSTDKASALNAMVDAIASSNSIEQTDDFRKAVFARERILSTGIGLGIAVPHAKIPSVKDFVLALGISHQGIPFDALDGKPVKIIVMIAGPEHRQEQYLGILARSTLILKSEKNRSAILAAASEDDVYQLFTQSS